MSEWVEETEIIKRMVDAMKTRAKMPLGNLPSLEPVLAGSLGDAWKFLACAALVAMLEPTEEMQKAGAYARENRKPVADIWRAMIRAAMKV